LSKLGNHVASSQELPDDSKSRGVPTAIAPPTIPLVPSGAPVSNPSERATFREQNCSGDSSDPYEVIFNETGLPTSLLTRPGGGWGLLFNQTTSTFHSSGIVDAPGPTSICTYASNGTGYSFWVYPYPGYAAIPSQGPLTVAGLNVIQNISFDPEYPVVFNETGLPAGTNWTVTVAGNVLNSTNSTIDYSEPNGTYSFSVGPITGFSPQPSYGTIKVRGTDVTVNITFALNYTVSFEEAGLPVGTEWTVSIGGVYLDSRTSLIVFAEPNGTFNYTVSGPSSYTATPAAGSVTIAGQDKLVSVSFYPTFSASVSFSETGLPSSTLWSVTLEAATRTSTTSEIQFQEYNGTYDFSVQSVYGFTVSPSSGSLVVNGGNVNVPVRFSARTYSVTFSESGVPIGSRWSVTLGSVGNASSEGTISFTEPNGTYAFAITATNPRWQSVTPDGFVGVNGTDQVVDIVFLYAFGVDVTESGLPTGTEWYFNLSGTASLDPTHQAQSSAHLDPSGSMSQGLYHQSNSSRTAAMVLWLPNGTYSYVVSSDLPGFRASKPHGNLTVDGAAPGGLQATFQNSSIAGTSSPSGSLTTLVAIGAIVALGLCLAAWVLIRRRPPPIPPPPPPPTYPNFPEDAPSNPVGADPLEADEAPTPPV
jgi:hypothetical protein